MAYNNSVIYPAENKYQESNKMFSVQETFEEEEEHNNSKIEDDFLLKYLADCNDPSTKISEKKKAIIFNDPLLSSSIFETKKLEPVSLNIQYLSDKDCIQYDQISKDVAAFGDYAIDVDLPTKLFNDHDDYIAYECNIDANNLFETPNNYQNQNTVKNQSDATEETKKVEATSPKNDSKESLKIINNFDDREEDNDDLNFENNCNENYGGILTVNFTYFDPVSDIEIIADSDEENTESKANSSANPIRSDLSNDNNNKSNDSIDVTRNIEYLENENDILNYDQDETQDISFLETFMESTNDSKIKFEFDAYEQLKDSDTEWTDEMITVI